MCEARAARTRLQEAKRECGEQCRVVDPRKETNPAPHIIVARALGVRSIGLPRETGPRSLIRDREGIYGAALALAAFNQLATMRQLLMSARAPV